MYSRSSTGGCSALIYLLAKHPILIVVLGLAGAMGWLNPSTHSGPLVASEEYGDQFEETIQSSDLTISQLIDKTTRFYESIVEVESGTKIADLEIIFQGVIAVHADEVSYGPAGLTAIAARDVLRKIPGCVLFNLDEVLLTPEENLKVAYIFFLDLVYRFKDVDTAVTAYNMVLLR